MKRPPTRSSRPSRSRPPSALLILTSSRPRALLPTLRSRCQEIRFDPLSDEHVRAILGGSSSPAAAAELRRAGRPGLNEEDVAAAVRLADGSADRALQLIESGCLEIRRKTLARILALPAEDVFELADDVLDWARAAAKQLEPQRERLRAFLYMLESTYRDIMVRAVCNGKEGPRQPALSEVEGPALSEVEGPALSEVEGPALSEVEGPALSEVEGPALSEVEGPALSEVEGPALSEVEGPALSEVEGPALSEVEGPALSEVEGPALSEVEGPDAAQRLSPRRLLGIHETLCDARRQIDANATIDLVLQDLFERIARLQRPAL